MKAPNGRSLIFQSETVTLQRCQARTAGIDGIEALELEQANGEVIWQLRQGQRGRVLSTGSGEFPQGIDEKAGLVGQQSVPAFAAKSATR